MQRKLIYVAFSCGYFSSPPEPYPLFLPDTLSTGMNLFSEVPLVHTVRVYVQVAFETCLCSTGSHYESGFSTCESYFEALKMQFLCFLLKRTVMSKRGCLQTCCTHCTRFVIY